jgi:hypothetical protein
MNNDVVRPIKATAMWCHSFERNVTERVTGTTDRYDIKDVVIKKPTADYIFFTR